MAVKNLPLWAENVALSILTVGISRYISALASIRFLCITLSTAAIVFFLRNNIQHSLYFNY